MRFSRFLQDYAVRLSKSKRSSKMNSPLIRSTDSVFTSSPVSIPEPAASKSGPGGRISLLKKQLDEQRYKITSLLLYTYSVAKTNLLEKYFVKSMSEKLVSRNFCSKIVNES